MKEKREKRLEKEFRKNIYELLTSKIKNPYITEMFAITAVTVTSDLETADVYVSVFSGSEEAKQRTFEAIASSAGEVRTLLSREMRIRTVPKLNFKKDESFAYGAKIDKIIDGFTYGEHNDDN
ncbi:MAG TPA: 30S ribosome-binding factor RbfA [Clostridiales bacterium]|nr:30S ribosome-binding factor RbfA [Clostridiales bacterium]